jgi:3-methyl-2-oxobutanoate hydroxymethyltransferase
MSPTTCWTAWWRSGRERVQNDRMSASKPVRRITISDIARMHEEGERFATITAYDYPTARIVDDAGIPLILVGDSLGMVMLGYDTTVRVSIDEMLHHTRAVARGAKRALVVGDMPFLSYGVSKEESVAHAGRFLSEAYAQAVKIEGGVRSARTLEAIVSSGIPVMGHIGLTPQAVNQLGGFRVQGRSKESARKLIADALAVQEAGAFAIVLELVPAELAKAITERLSIPTIGIGAGPHTSAEIQVVTDVIGLTQGFTPRHARRFGEIGEALAEAVRGYRDAVQSGTFPAEAESSSMDEAVLDEVLGRSELDQAEHHLAIPLDRDL